MEREIISTKNPTLTKNTSYKLIHMSLSELSVLITKHNLVLGADRLLVRTVVRCL